MSCKLDVREAILSDAKRVLNENIPVKYRNTYSWVDESTIRINNRADNAATRVQSKSKATEQAYSIAQWIKNKIGEVYGTHVSAYVNETSRYDPITINIIPSEGYIDYEYSNLPEERQNDSTTQVQREFDRKMSEEQIDEWGDSVPMYERELDISTLGDVDKIMYESSPEEYLQMVYDQITNTTSSGIVSDAAGEPLHRIIRRYGQPVVDAARAYVFEKSLRIENTALGTIGIEQILNKIQESLDIQAFIINEEEAVQLTAGTLIPYQGEPAFFFKDNVYLVKGKFDTGSKLHELIHPFVRAIAKYNTPLFNNLYKEAVKQKDVMNHVSGLYPELVDMAEKGNSLPFMEEFIVYLIQKSAVKQINNLPQEEQNMLEKFWNALKYFFRQIFQPKISLNNINENTSVEELTKTLLFSNSKIDLRGKDGLWNFAFPMLNRSFLPKMEEIKSKLDPQIETFFAVTKAHLERIRNSKNLKELKEILGNDEQNNPIVEARNFLNLANKLIDDLDNDKNKMLTFSEALSSISAMSERMINHVEEFVKNDQVGEKYKIGVLVNYGYLIKDWKQVLNDFNNQLGYKNDPLKSEIVATLDRFNSMETIMKDFNKNIGLVKIFKSEFDSNLPLKKSLEELEKEIEDLKADYNKGNTSVKKRIEERIKLFEQANPTEENIAKWLSGEMGDTNTFSMMFESYTSNPNPIVGGFANYYFKEKAKLDARLQQKNSKFFQKFKGIFEKFKIDRNAIEDTFDKITDTVKVFFIDKDGNQQSRDVKVFANQYAGDYQYKDKKFQSDLETMDRKSPEYLETKKEYEQFKNDFMFSDASDVVNQSQQFWLQSALHSIAYDTRKKILDEIEVQQKVRPTTAQEVEIKNETLKILWRRYSRLSSDKRVDGTPKTQDEAVPENNTLIADIFKEHREKFGNLYERIEINQAFESAKKLQEDKLKLEGMVEGSDEYKDAMTLWLSENMRIANSPKFYEDRQKILDEIKGLTDKLGNADKQKMDISNLWGKIFDEVKGFRDEDGQPIGVDLTLAQQKQIADLEAQIEKVRETLAKRSGLSKQESETYYTIRNKITRQVPITKEEREIYNTLFEKKKSVSKLLTKEESERLTQLFGELRDFQTKVPTDYYMEEFNKWMERIGQPQMTFVQLRKEIPLGVIENLFVGNPEFEEWFTANHSIKEKWNSDSRIPDLVYERNYVWNRILPKDDEIEKAIEEGDYSALLASTNPYLSATPSNEYFFYTLKKEFKTPRIEGVTIDNRGDFLPRPTQRTATPEQAKLMEERGIAYAVDGRYESKIFLELKNNPAYKGYDELNELYKSHHLDSQKDLDRYARLWYEVPRMRKTTIENVTVDNAKQGITNLKSWWDTVNPFVKKEVADAFTENQGNWEMPEISKQYVMTDLFGNQPTQIPIKYTSFIEEDKMSKDLGQLVVEYGISAETNKMNKDLNPIAQTLKETLLENKIKQTNAIAKNFLGLKFNSPKVLEKDKVASNMYKSVNNFIETFIEGKEKKYELGVGFDRFANHLMKLGAFGSLALSPVASIRNLASGNLQKTLEGISGKNFEGKDILKGEINFDTKYIPSLIKDYTQVGARSLETQMFELFDPLINYTDIVGDRLNRSLKSDLASLKFVYSFQKGGEIHVQGSTFVIMLENQKVDFTDPATGVVTKIPYGEAWTLKDDIIALRDGVDKAWDMDSDNFAQFKLRVQTTNERLQGAYAKENMSEVQRTTWGTLLTFMRKYFVPMFMNRFSNRRLNVSAGDFREGYYKTSLKAMSDTLKNGKKNWHTYTQDEKRNMMKTAAEIGYSLMFTAILSLLGWDDDDDDKYKKLENDWVRAYLIYQIMAIKSESETFIPIPTMGMDEWLRNITTPTVAWNVLKKYRKMSEDLLLWTVGSEDAYYDKSYGVYDKGDVKFLADLYNTIGIKSWLLLEDPSEGVKQYVQMSRRY